MDLRTLREAAGIGDPVERARALGQMMTEVQVLGTQAATYRRHAIAEARAAGLIVEKIAGAVGGSPGRISQLGEGPSVKTPERNATAAPAEWGPWTPPS